MDIDKKSRADLRGRFKRNMIPTEQDFFNLIDAAMNGKDDGITRLSGDALSIEAATKDAHPALKLYDCNEKDPTWVLNLLVGDPADGKKGLVLTDAGGSWKLSLDKDSGRLTTRSLNTGALTASDAITANGGLMVPARQMLSADALTASGMINANGGLTIPAGQTLTASGVINANGGLTIPVGWTLNANGPLNANGGLTVPAGQTLSASGPLNAYGGLFIPAGQTLNASGAITANGGLTAPAGRTINANGGLTVPAGQTLTVDGALLANQGLTIPADKTLSTGGLVASTTIRANGGLSVGTDFSKAPLYVFIRGRESAIAGLFESALDAAFINLTTAERHTASLGILPGGKAVISNDAGQLTITQNGDVKIDKSVTCASLVATSGSKQFQIDHPLDRANKTLAHAALEGPEAGVYYRGEGQLEDGRAVITLPSYFEALTRREGRTVMITPRWDEDDPVVSALAVTGIKDGRFTVRAIDQQNPRQHFYWEVKAVRGDLPELEVEILKKGSETKAPK